MNTSGTKNLSISYDGVSTSVTITVKEKAVTISSIGISVLPNKLTYNINEQINTSGLVLKVNYSNGSSQEITSGFTISGNTASSGDRTITVSYSGFKVTYKITVVDKNLKLESIEIEKLPDKVKFNINESFSYDGLTIKCNYSNGSTKSITKGFTVTADTSEKGLKKATVKYQNKEVKYGITIEDKKAEATEKIIIDKMPTKDTFSFNEEISFEGLVVKYIDKDKKESIITDYKINDFEKKYGTNTITVSYKDVTTNFDIDIIDDTIESLGIMYLNENRYYSKTDKLNEKEFNLIVKYKDGTKKLIKKDIDFEYDFAKSNTVIAKYNGKLVKFDIKLASPIITMLINNIYLIIGIASVTVIGVVSTIVIIRKRRVNNE